MPGYSDEPYLRIGPDGVWRNAAQPGDLHQPRPLRPGHAAGRRPTRAAAPQWVRMSTAAALRVARPPHALDDAGPAAAGGGRRPDRAPHRASRGPCRCATATPAGRRARRAHLDPAAVALAGLAGVRAAGPAAGGGRAAGPHGPAARPGWSVGAVAGLWHALATPAPPATRRRHTGAIVAALLPALLTGRRGRGRRPVGACAGAACMTGLLAVVARLAAAGRGPARRRRAVVGARAGDRPAAGGPRRGGGAGRGRRGAVLGGIAAVRRFRDPAAAVPAGAVRAQARGLEPEKPRRGQPASAARGVRTPDVAPNSALARSRSVSKSTSTAENAEMSSGRNRRPSLRDRRLDAALEVVLVAAAAPGARSAPACRRRTRS